jgi:hypothetical protein
VHDELGSNSFEPDERVPPESSDKARGTRDVKVEERVTNRHKEVEPDLRARSDEDCAAPASSAHEIGTESGCRDLVDRSEGLRTPEHDSRPIRIAKGRKAARRLGGDDELARSQATLDYREALTIGPLAGSRASAQSQIPTAIPKEGAT